MSEQSSTLNVKISELAASRLSARGVTKMVVGVSVRFVISGAITAVVPVETKKDRVKVFVASHVLSGLIVDKAKEKVDKEFDEWAESWKEAQETFAAMQAEQATATPPEAV